MKKYVLTFMIFSLLGILSTACTPTTNASANLNPATTVHMSETQFAPETITIQKGQKLAIVDDSSVVHVIQNGRWDSNGTPRPTTETGAPAVQVQFNGDDVQSVGPFNTAGTFHLYCTIHNNMNLTVIVK